MANRNTSTATAAGATLNVDRNSIHARHSWLEGTAKSDANAIFAARVMDISRGARVIADILYDHLADLGAISSGSTDVRTLLSENDMEALGKLAVTSLDMLYAMAEKAVDRLNEAAEQGVKA